MVDFGLDKVFCLKYKTAISQEPLGVWSWNFQSSHISMIPKNGVKMNKFWEVRGSSSKEIGWFDMELSYSVLESRCLS